MSERDRMGVSRGKTGHSYLFFMAEDVIYVQPADTSRTSSPFLSLWLVKTPSFVYWLDVEVLFVINDIKSPTVSFPVYFLAWFACVLLRKGGKKNWRKEKIRSETERGEKKKNRNRRSTAFNVELEAS
jgi:hypothetical protein